MRGSGCYGRDAFVDLVWEKLGFGHVLRASPRRFGTTSVFFMDQESPAHGTRGPASAGFTTVRIELFVDDPIAVHRHALGAGDLE